MQSVSTAFHRKVTGAVRGITWRALISFRKDFDDNITFFTIGDSLIGGTDIIKGDNNVIQEWDKYTYEDFANRIKSIEYTRESELPTSPVSLAIADIEMDNHDDLFTPDNTSSPYYGYLKPRRPIKLFTGFKGAEELPVFIGVTDGLPQIDDKKKTVKFHCIDFLKSIMDIKIQEEIILEDYVTSDAISYLLQNVGGLLTSQFNLDAGSVVVPFIYFKKDSTLGDALREIAEAELGSLYLDENGVIRFENRTNWNSKSRVWGFDNSQVLEINTPAPDKIINVVEVYGRPRAVQANQLLWEQANVQEIPPNGTLEVFANFQDEYGDLPVTTVDPVDYITSATTSLYATNTERDGSGSIVSSGISIAEDQFGTAYKMTFTNANAFTVYVTQLELWARPAKVINDIYVRLQDSASIGANFEGFDERIHKIQNDYIQDEAAANTIAQIILTDRAEVDDQRIMLVKGLPQLQIGDVVGYKNSKLNQTYFVTRINGIMNTSGFRQRIMVSKRTLQPYFRIGISTIGGTDLIGP